MGRYFHTKFHVVKNICFSCLNITDIIDITKLPKHFGTIKIIVYPQIKGLKEHRLLSLCLKVL
jgi:hypothetical protein